MSATPLQLKLQLLRALRTGSLAQITPLISQISAVTKINPELYHKFATFIEQNKSGLEEMEREEKQQNEPVPTVIENVDGDIEDGYRSDESWTDGSSDDEEEPVSIVREHQAKKSTVIFKEVNNVHQKGLVKAESTTNLKKTPTNPTLAFKKQTPLTITHAAKPGSSSSSGVQAKNVRNKI